MRPISILYIHPCGTFGGASRSLLEVINSFPADTIIPHIITPRGNVVDYFHKVGCQVITTLGIAQFDNTRFGHYRGWRWLVLLRELTFSFFTVSAMFKARKRWKGINLVHVNELTLLLPIVVAKFVFNKSIVVQVRSVQAAGQTPRRTKIMTALLKRFADAVIPIDETVRRSLAPDLPVHVVHNGFTIGQYLKSDIKSDEVLQRLQKLSRETIKIGMVGNLLRMKGVYEFVEAARICRNKQLQVDFIIVGGETRKLKGIKGWLLQKLGFAHNVKADILEYCHRYGLEKIVHLVGFTSAIREFYEKIDIVCFPSHLEAVGRPVFEAAFSKVPSIIAITNPLEDTVVAGETALCFEPGNAEALAEAIEYFCLNPQEMRRMGEKAYALAIKNFDVRKNARTILEIYQKLV